MEFPHPVETNLPAAIITLTDCDVELNRGADGLIHIWMRPVGIPIVIDYPWQESQLRVVLTSWLAGLRGEDNGQPETPET